MSVKGNAEEPQGSMEKEWGEQLALVESSAIRLEIAVGALGNLLRLEHARCNARHHTPGDKSLPEHAEIISQP